MSKKDNDDSPDDQDSLRPNKKSESENAAPAPTGFIHDAKAQADHILSTVSDMIATALRDIQVTAGDPNTIIHSGYPCTVITTRE